MINCDFPTPSKRNKKGSKSQKYICKYKKPFNLRLQSCISAPLAFPFFFVLRVSWKPTPGQKQLQWNLYYVSPCWALGRCRWPKKSGRTAKSEREKNGRQKSFPQLSRNENQGKLRVRFELQVGNPWTNLVEIWPTYRLSDSFSKKPSLRILISFFVSTWSIFPQVVPMICYL